jgi:hypothetical protein
VRLVERTRVRRALTPEHVASLLASAPGIETRAPSLTRADVPLVLAQKLMRHSDPKLTANVSTKLELHDARVAVARVDVGTNSNKPTAKRLGRGLGRQTVLSTDNKGLTRRSATPSGRESGDPKIAANADNSCPAASARSIGVVGFEPTTPSPPD